MNYSKHVMSSKLRDLFYGGKTFGIEHTRVPVGWNPESNELSAKYEDLDDYVLSLRYSESFKELSASGATIIDDCGAIEIASPVFTCEQDIDLFWNRCQRFFKSSPIKLAPDTEDKKGLYIEGGGGHIHIGNLANSRIQRSINYFFEKPYMVWFFSDWCDEDSLTCNYIRDYYENMPSELKGEPIYKTHMSGYLHTMGLNNRVGPVSLRKNIYGYKWVQTTEFRFFRSYKSLSHLKECLLLAYAIANSYDYSESLIVDYSRYQSMPDSLIIELFREEIDGLGLDCSVYDKYIKYFKDRKKHGKLFLPHK